LGGTQAVRRALAVLGAFTDQTPEWGLADLSRSLHLTKSTTLRLLGALEREGLLSRFGPNGSYRLGPTAIELGARAQRVHSLPGTAHAELLRLARSTGETTSLEVLIGNEILILDEVLGTHLVGRSSSIGTRWPAHAASTGKVLLAAARQGNVETWQGAPLDSPLELEQYTPRTITSRQKFDAELNRVAKLGYATAIGELEVGYVAIGAPIRNNAQHVVAAICVGGPSNRLTEARIPALAAELRQSADRISRQLGARL
jgi:IclR family acetate operon transcriptional repressor